MSYCYSHADHAVRNASLLARVATLEADLAEARRLLAWETARHTKPNEAQDYCKCQSCAFLAKGGGE